MLYFTIIITVVAFLLYVVRKKARCMLSNVDAALLAIIFAFGFGTLLIGGGLLTDAHSYCVKLKTIDTQRMAITSYFENEKMSNNENSITITYATENGNYNISLDGTTNIEKTSNCKPKYVTVTKDQYYNVATLIPNIHTTYSFSPD